MPSPVQSSRTITVDHLIIESEKSFERVRAALERDVLQLDTTFITRLRAGDVAGAKKLLEQGQELAIFGVREHGNLLAIAGKPRKALQYDIGNPLTASKMTRHELFCASLRRCASYCMRTTEAVRPSNTTSRRTCSDRPTATIF